MTNQTATLPLRLLCQLILASHQGPHQETSVDANSGLIAVHQQPLQRILSESVPSISIPEGYVPHPEIGLAYKLYNASVSWPEARKRCNAEGANLAVIDSRLKLGFVARPTIFQKTHVGMLRIYDNQLWSSVITGLSVDSIPWAAGEPSGDHDCAMVGGAHDGIINYGCNIEGNFVCEIPIPENQDSRGNKLLEISVN